MSLPQKLLLAATATFGLLTAWVVFFGEAGPDGLGTFFPLIICGAGFLGCGAGFGVSLLGKGDKPRQRNKVIGFALAIPVLTLLGIAATIFGFQSEYRQGFAAQIEQEQAATQTLDFRSAALRVGFTHVSGALVGSSNGEPVVEPIRPREIDSSLLVVARTGTPVEIADVIALTAKDAQLSLEAYGQLTLADSGLGEDCQLKPVRLAKLFPQLTPSTVALQLDARDCPGQPIARTFPGVMRLGDISFNVVYFLEDPRDRSRVLVIGLHNPFTSVAATSERLSMDNAEDGNSWWNALRWE